MARPKSEVHKDAFIHTKITKEQDEAIKRRAKELGLNKSSYITLLFSKDIKDKLI